METGKIKSVVDSSSTDTNVGNSSSASDINFEDLIKVTNVTQRGNKDEISDELSDSTEQEKIKSTNESSKLNFTKIAPKPLSSNTNQQSGQVVIIQGPTGSPQPIRISGVSSTGPAKQTPVTIQVLKMADGNVLQIKNNKSLNLTNLSGLTQVNLGSKKVSQSTNSNLDRVILKNASVSQMVLTPQQKLSTSNSGNSIGSTTVLKSITSAEAHKAGLFKLKSSESGGKQLQKILPASSTIITSSSTTSSSINSTIKQNRLILPDTKGVVMKSENEINSKQIIVPQHVLKLSPATAGPIQAIQIAGKAGVQYVRVLGTAVSGVTTSTTSKSSMQTALKTKDSSPTKVSFVASSSSSTSSSGNGQRIIMNTAKNKQNLTVINANKSSNNTLQSGTTKQNIKGLIASVPTLRKIQAPTATKVIVVKKEDDIKLSQSAKLKVSSLNTQMPVKKLSSSIPIEKNNQERQNVRPQYFMVPQEYFRKIKTEENDDENDIDALDNVSQRKLYSVLKPGRESPEEINNSHKKSPSIEDLRRKHCNCTKSQCLKLYCDCFANGEFCQDCNCKECFNNLENEDERQKAIRICLERNPNAFKPKITKARDQSDLRLHNKGCNCKRSGCLKNYCECYEAKITCSSNCKCFGCRNIEDRSEMDPYEVAKIAQNFGRDVPMKRPHEEDKTIIQATPAKQPYNFITSDVVDATVQCMLAQADECKTNCMAQCNTEKMILEELGRCLVEIIDFSIRNMDN